MNEPNPIFPGPIIPDSTIKDLFPESLSDTPPEDLPEAPEHYESVSDYDPVLRSHCRL